MDFSLTPTQQEIREAVLKICARFGDDYWLARDADGAFPHEFHQALAGAGWLGIPCRRPTVAPGWASPRPPS